ncbi:MAG TPA: hypothetical protein VED20_01900 [Streptosporangiaceae bacterium]|nr:hypothetical protein [Streptosporangiaceae bacterium]
MTSVARSVYTRIGVDEWVLLPLCEQCALPPKDRRVVGWLIVTGRVRPTPDYLVACRPYLGEVAARHHQAFHARFSARSAELGFDRVVTRLQWSALVKVAAVVGLTPGWTAPWRGPPAAAITRTGAPVRAVRASGRGRPALRGRR